MDSPKFCFQERFLGLPLHVCDLWCSFTCQRLTNLTELIVNPCTIAGQRPFCNANAPSVLAITYNACKIPLYLAVCSLLARSSPCSCSLVFTMSMGFVIIVAPTPASPPVMNSMFWFFACWRIKAGVKVLPVKSEQ